MLASLTGFMPTDAPKARRMPEDRQGCPTTERSEGVGVPNACQLEPTRCLAQANRRTSSDRVMIDVFDERVFSWSNGERFLESVRRIEAGDSKPADLLVSRPTRPSTTPERSRFREICGG